MPTIAVFGGTPADTRMGAAYLRGVGQMELLEYPVAASPRAQALFQNGDAAAREAHVRGLLQEAMTRGAAGTYVYCNSLSGAVDFDRLGAELAFPIVTPLHAYARWAQQYTVLGIMAANASGLGGIERTLYAANPDIRLTQFAALDVVEAIEQGEEVMERFGLWAVAELLTRLGAEAIVLGCTHFSAFGAELAPLSPVPLLDPTQEMWALLREKLA